MNRVYLGLGSNMGNREENLQKAIETFHADTNVVITEVSSVYETSPVGKTRQPDFLNAVIQGQTMLSPPALLKYIKSIEVEMGREKTERWGPRVIDIDILLYGDVSMVTDELTIPHAAMKERAFVLIPLAEIAPRLVFPDGTFVCEHLENLSQGDRVILREDISLTDPL